MSSKIVVDDFIACRNLAVVGVSRNPRKFGNAIFKELRKKNYNVFPINPNMNEIEGINCYPDLTSVKEKIDGVILSIPPEKTLPLVHEAHKNGISRIWFQQGSSHKDSIKYCEDMGIKYVKDECIMMFAEPVGSVHKFHKWIWKIFGKLPK